MAVIRRATTVVATRIGESLGLETDLLERLSERLEVALYPLSSTVSIGLGRELGNDPRLEIGMREGEDAPRRRHC